MIDRMNLRFNDKLVFFVSSEEEPKTEQVDTIVKTSK